MKEDIPEYTRKREEARRASGELVAERQIERELQGGGFRKSLSLFLRFVVPVGLTVILVWYMFRKIDISGLVEGLRRGIDYWWIVLAMLLSIVSHMARAARWRIQLESLGIKTSFMALCYSVFGCYAINLAIPRLGEVWRCTYVAKRSRSQFTTVLGSMVAERLCDGITVIALILLTFILAASAINAFIVKYSVGQNIMNVVENPVVWSAIFISLVLLAGSLFFFRKTRPVKKLLKWTQELWLGFAGIWQMKRKLAFLLLTAAIWGCYYFQLYLAFFAFDFTRALCDGGSPAFGLVACLVAFVLSALGMAIPSSGGLGPWNLAVIFGLAVYGVSETDGTLFSMVQWSGQTIMLIILGIFTMIYTSLQKNER